MFSVPFQKKKKTHMFSVRSLQVRPVNLTESHRITTAQFLNGAASSVFTIKVGPSPKPSGNRYRYRRIILQGHVEETQRNITGSTTQMYVPVLR